MRARVALLGAVAVATSGCSALVDTIYLAGSRRFDTSMTERAPTGETSQAMEYAARSVEGGLELTCARVTRGIDRTWTVHRTWQRRGGFDRGTYAGTAFASGFFAAITGGVLLGMCLSDEADVDCAWTAAAAPLALDVGYGLIRRAMVSPPKLVARERSGDSIALGDVLQTEPNACDALRDLAIGGASGTSPEAALSAETPDPQRLVEPGARHLALAGTRATLTIEDAELWATTGRLWAVDADGVAHLVTIDRCVPLRPFAPRMAPAVRTQFDQACPPPAAAPSASTTPGTPAPTEVPPTPVTPGT